jgi:hypothetical protein
MSACLKSLLGLAGLVLVAPAFAGPVVSTALAVREIYDDNVFIQDDAPLAAGQTAAALPANAHAFITDLGATLGLAWKVGPAWQADLGYAPESFRYSRYPSENHADHRFTAGASGAAGPWSYEGKASWLSTKGSEESPFFNRLGGSPPVGSEPVRARRTQDIGKAGGRVTRSFGGGFVRGVFTLLTQDFHTRDSSTACYTNFVDRSEWTAGADLGWALRPNLFLVAAARGGAQQQANLLGVAHNYANTMSRWLVGAEGRLGPDCKFSALAGPDVRRYGSEVRAGFNRDQTTTYLEANASWTPTRSDLVSLTSRRWVWLTSGGRCAYVDIVYDLAWKHQLNPQWNLGAGFNQHLGNTGRYNLSSPRRDLVDAVTGSLAYALGPKAKLDLCLAQDWSATGVPATPSRVYHRRVCSLGYSQGW